MGQVLNRALTYFFSNLLKALIHPFPLLVATRTAAVIGGFLPTLVAFREALAAAGVHNWLLFLGD